jgi:hypothetical protein
MDAWSRSFAACPNSAQRAHASLIEMEQMAAGDSQSLMKPNYASYSTVVNAVSVIATPSDLTQFVVVVVVVALLFYSEKRLATY